MQITKKKKLAIYQKCDYAVMVTKHDFYLKMHAKL